MKDDEYQKLTKHNEILEAKIIQIKERSFREIDSLNAEMKWHENLLDSLNDMVFEVNPDGAFLYVNNAITRIFGYEPAEVIGKSPFDKLVAGENKKKLSDLFIKTIKKQESFQLVDNYIQASNGICLSLEISANPFYTEDGIFAGFRGVVRDITEKKVIEKKLIESEERFRALHELTSGGIGIHDNGIIVEANKGLVDLMGYSYEELVGMDGLNLIAEEERDKVRSRIIEGDTALYDSVGLKKDGTKFDLEIHGRKIPWQGREVRVTEFRDITERKKYEKVLFEKNKELQAAMEELEAAMEELEAMNEEIVDAHDRLRTSEDKYRRIIDNSNEIILLVNTTDILFVNGSVEKLTGFKPEEFIEKGFLGIVHPEDIQKVMDYNLSRINGEDIPESYDIRIFHKNKEIKWFHVNASAIEWNEQSASLVFISDITDSKKAGVLLEEAKLMMEAVIEQSPAGIIYADLPHMKVRIINRRMIELLMVERDCLGENIYDFLENKSWTEYQSTGEEIKDDDSFLVKVLEGEKIVNFELTIKRSDGSLKHVLINGIPVKNKNQEIVGGLVFSLDISMRKVAENELKKTLSLLQAVIEEAPFAISVAEREGESWRIILYNREAQRINGKPMIQEYIDAESEMKMMTEISRTEIGFRRNPLSRAIFDGEEIRNEEVVIKQEDGSEVWISVSAAPIYDDSGEIFAAVASFPEVTEMKQLEYRMKIQNDELVAMNEELVAANEEYEAINEELIASQSELEESEARYRELNEELEKRVRDRTAELERSMNALRDTQHKLVQSEKMASLGELVAGVAHEINTPVGVSVTAASFLAEKIHELEKMYQGNVLRRSDIETFIGSSLDSTTALMMNLERAVELIRSFKQVSVDQSSENRRKFKLHDYIDEILLSLRSRYKRTGHSIEVDCPEDLELDSFPGVYFQIITNLVMNSLLHAFEGIDSGKIIIKASKMNQSLILVYTDNGNGMNEVTLNKIFDPFYTTKRGKGGSGLGMHIVYNLVTQKLNGSILCESQPGEGVRFEIVVPIKLPQ